MRKEKNDVDVEKILKEYNKDVKRHFNVVAEGLDNKISTIAEQYGSIKKDIHGIKETLDSHTEMIGSLMEDMETVKSNIEFLKGSLKKKVDYDEFVALERRMTLLESKVRS